MAAVLRAAFFYCFLVLIVRIAGRRPGKQRAPFEFVLVFFLGGLALTAMVADDRSLTNAVCQIVMVATMHCAISWLRQKSPRFALLTDGTPLVLLERGRWREPAMRQSGISDDDVMEAARQQGLESLDQVRYAVLERSGEISIVAGEAQG